MNPADQSSEAVTRMMMRRLNNPIVMLILANLLLLQLFTIAIGGSALIGRSVDGRYYLGTYSHIFLGGPDGGTVETSHALYLVSMIDGWVVALSMIGLMLWLVLIGMQWNMRPPKA